MSSSSSSSSSTSTTTVEVPQQAIHSSSSRHHHNHNQDPQQIYTNDIPLRDLNKNQDNLNIAISQFESTQQNENIRRRRSRNQNNENLKTEEEDGLMYNSEKLGNTFPEGGREANLVLLGSFMGLVADFGIPNTLGAIESYVSSNQLKNVSKSEVGWVFSLYLGVMYLFNVFFGHLFDSFGAKRPLIAGTLMICVGILLTAQCEKLYQFVLSFSILTALGCSIAMSPLIGALSHWYLRKRAMACSIATIGGLVGASVFAIMLQQLYDKIGFKNAMRVLSCICFFCMSCSIFLVRERKPEDKQNLPSTTSINFEIIEEEVTIPDGQNEVELQNQESTKTNLSIKSKINHFFKEALDLSVLKDMKFVSLTMAVFLSEVVSMTTLTYLGSYALAFNVNNTSAYLILTIVNICGIPSRLLSGIIADKYGRFNMMIITSLFTTINIFALWLPAKNVKLLYVFSVFFGISTSAVLSLIPACVGQICSSETFGKIYGTLYFFLGFLTILGMYLATLVINKETQQNYRNFVIFEGLLSFASVLSWIWAKYAAVGWKIWSKF